MSTVISAVSSSSSALAPADQMAPIVSSQTLGWEPLLMEEFQQPPGGVDIPEAWQGHSIALCLAPRPHRIHQVVGNRRYTGLYSKGDVSIMPAGVPASYWAEGEDHYVHIQLPSEFLQAVAQDALERDAQQIELVTEFRVRDPQLEQTLLMLRAELRRGGGLLGRLYVESLANVLAVHLLRNYSTMRPRISLYDGGLGERKLLQVTDYMNDHIDQEIKLADLAQLLDMSQFHFSRLFKQSMGMSPHQYLLQQRVERAKELLTHTNQSLVEVALASGFNSQSHLSRTFRQLTGTTPKTYRAASRTP